MTRVRKIPDLRHMWRNAGEEQWDHVRQGWLGKKERLAGYGDGSLKHFLRQSLQELGIRVQRLGPAEGKPQLSGFLLGLVVNVSLSLTIGLHTAASRLVLG